MLPGYPARLDSLATKGLAAYLIATRRSSPSLDLVSSRLTLPCGGGAGSLRGDGPVPETGPVRPRSRFPGSDTRAWIILGLVAMGGAGLENQTPNSGLNSLYEDRSGWVLKTDALRARAPALRSRRRPTETATACDFYVVRCARLPILPRTRPSNTLERLMNEWVLSGTGPVAMGDPS